MPQHRIKVLLADDNVIVREGLRSLLATAPDIDVVGVAADYPGLLARAAELEPDVVVTDIRMPPSFQLEGIHAAREIRRLRPATGVVVLSQYDDPEYAVTLFSDGTSGYAYLLKDRVAEGEQLVRAIRAVGAGRSVLDPIVVENLARPVAADGILSADEEILLRMVAEGRPIKAMAVARQTTPAAVARQLDELFLTLARQASGGAAGALRQLERLHQSIVEREEHGALMNRLVPGGVATEVLRNGWRVGETVRLHVTVLMSDIRGYSAIAEFADPSHLAGQLREHRTELSRALLAEGGTIMQFVGDAVMGAFGAPVPLSDHAAHALAAAELAQEAQAGLNARWSGEGRESFHLGIGLSTGVVAAALLGSDERMEYSLIGDCVNLAQRLQELAGPGEIVIGEATWSELPHQPPCELVGPLTVKGRQSPVRAYRLAATARPGR